MSFSTAARDRRNCSFIANLPWLCKEDPFNFRGGRYSTRNGRPTIIVAASKGPGRPALHHLRTSRLRDLKSECSLAVPEPWLRKRFPSPLYEQLQFKFFGEG